MAFKAPYMSVLDVCLEGRHYMAMMPPNQRSHHQGHATAGPSGAFAVVAVVVGSTKRRLQNLKQRRKKDYFLRKKKINPLLMLLEKLTKVLQVLMHVQKIVVILGPTSSLRYHI
jgi:hypothetical protein